MQRSMSELNEKYTALDGGMLSEGTPNTNVLGRKETKTGTKPLKMLMDF